MPDPKTIPADVYARWLTPGQALERLSPPLERDRACRVLIGHLQAEAIEAFAEKVILDTGDRRTTQPKFSVVPLETWGLGYLEREAEDLWHTGYCKVSPTSSMYPTIVLLGVRFDPDQVNDIRNKLGAPSPAEATISPKALELALADYDRVTADVIGSSRPMFLANLGLWLELIDRDPVFADLTIALEGSVDYGAWRARLAEAIPPDTNKGQLRWPIGEEKRVGAQIYLFRDLNRHEDNWRRFVETYLEGTPFLNVGLPITIENLFKPASRDYRALFLRAAAPGQGVESVIPASDRFVTMGDNSEEHKAVVESVTALIHALDQTNIEIDPEDRARLSADLKTGLGLLQMPEVRLSFLTQTLVQPVKFIAAAVATGVIGDMAIKLLPELLKFLNLLV